MISPLSPTIPPVSVGTALDAVFALIALATDPKACGARLAEIVLERVNAVDVINQAAAIKAEIAKEREALKAERAEQEKLLADARFAFESSANARDAQINDRRDETERLALDAQAARDEAVSITEHLRVRLLRVKEAAAA